MLIAAIDPGLSGGLAVIDDINWSYRWASMPVVRVKIGDGKERGWVDIPAIENWFDGNDYCALVIEQQWPRPGEGATPAFTAGANLGRITAAKIGRKKVLMPPPVTWKMDLGVPREQPGTTGKPEATRFCRDIFGEKAPTRDGPAEALLLAYWYWKRSNEYGARADDGVLVEPRTVRPRRGLPGSAEPGGNGVFSGEYTPPDARSAGRLFAGSDRSHGKKARARRGAGGD